MNEASGRLGRARFLRLGYYRRPIEEPGETLAEVQQPTYKGMGLTRVNHRQSPRRFNLQRR